MAMPPRFFPPTLLNLQRLIGPVITIPVLLIIVCAVWVSGAAVMENLRFSRATDQILSVVSAARDYAARDKNFALTPGEDQLELLSRLGVIGSVSKDGQYSRLIN